MAVSIMSMIDIAYKKNEPYTGIHKTTNDKKNKDYIEKQILEETQEIPIPIVLPKRNQQQT